ncbi:LVIVD repeat-containing protein [Lutibacter citreus]|uniref:LVIVD repeat-containing protein n=1 Tax=Lutibacter citreus TaxID=2138210 RepID=UPI000DBE3A70|nr:hypothetical protein [Lutibacter citreus]
MKTKNIFLIFATLLFMLSCNEKDDNLETVNVAKAEYMSLKALRSSVDIIAPRPIDESGKIYAYKNLVLVNDVEKGIHIIDNSNPAQPVKKAFIKIIANKDMEIKGDFLYADSLMDLVVFDISDLNNIFEVARLEDVFPWYVPMPLVDNLIVDYGEGDNTQNEIIVGWDISQERRNIEDVKNDYNTGGVFFDNTFALASSESTGQGGSLARFKIVDEYLYAVDSHNINIFNISNLEKPRELNDVHAGFDIETIFNRGDQLFLGSMSGMYIYDISKPGSPQFVSEFQHGTACDPVVVDDKYAYITLRAGNFCGAFDSSLEIVDVSDIYNIEHVKSYSMDNPYGLGIKDDLLFICDGTSGLKVYNKENVEELKLINTFKNINTFDVIPMENNLLLIGDNTLYQYKYSGESIDLLSEFHLN